MKYTPMSRRDTVAEWWESEPSHQRGMEIAADVKAKTGRYRPLMEPLRCRNCTASGKTARMIPALYAGPDGSVWLWTAGYRGLVNHPEEKDQEVRAERILLMPRQTFGPSRTRHPRVPGSRTLSRTSCTAWSATMPSAWQQLKGPSLPTGWSRTRPMSGQPLQARTTRAHPHQRNPHPPLCPLRLQRSPATVQPLCATTVRTPSQLTTRGPVRDTVASRCFTSEVSRRFEMIDRSNG